MAANYNISGFYKRCSGDHDSSLIIIITILNIMERVLEGLDKSRNVTYYAVSEDALEGCFKNDDIIFRSRIQDGSTEITESIKNLLKEVKDWKMDIPCVSNEEPCVACASICGDLYEYFGSSEWRDPGMDCETYMWQGLLKFINDIRLMRAGGDPKSDKKWIEDMSGKLKKSPDVFHIMVRRISSTSVPIVWDNSKYLMKAEMSDIFGLTKPAIVPFNKLRKLIILMARTLED